MPKGFYDTATRRNWTQEELDELEDLLHQGKSYAVIAERLNRSQNAVTIIRKRRGLPSITDATLNGRKVAALLGMDSTTVSRWIRRGMLRGRRSVARGGERQWFVSEKALLDFLSTPEYWMCWDAERIADYGLREWATETRTYRWLCVGDVAERYGVIPGAVRSWIRRGLLPSARYGNWWIPEPALEGFVPPYARGKAGQVGREYTAAEIARLVHLRESGATWAEIAEAMGRTPSSVSNRYRRIVARRERAA